MNLSFKRIEAEDIETLEPYFYLRPTLVCDSTWFDSYLWRDYYEVCFCRPDENAILWRMKEEGQHSMGMPLCKAEDLSKYFEVTRQYCHEVLQSPLRIYEADEEAIQILNLDPEKYLVEEAVDSADYVYSAESLRTLAGKDYHKKKNHVNSFLKEYEGRFEYRRFNCASKQEIWQFLDRWEQNKGDDVGHHLDAEVVGLHDVLNHCEFMRAKMGGIWIDGRLEAFTIGTYNAPRKMAVIHIEKANPEIRGLYPFINQRFLQEEFPDAELVNREDDVGLPGLRKAKQSYHPLFMARKFNIFEKE